MFQAILNKSENDWARVSNINCMKDTVNSPPNVKDKKNITFSCLGGHRHKPKTSEDRSPKTGLWLRVRPAGYRGCHFNAISLTPQQCIWAQDVVRKHAMTCFKVGQLTAFPQQYQRQSVGVVYNRDISICSNCKLPYDSETYGVKTVNAPSKHIPTEDT